MRLALKFALIAVVIVGVVSAVYSSSVSSGGPMSAGVIVGDASVSAAENSGSFGCELALAGLTIVGTVIYMLRPRRRAV